MKLEDRFGHIPELPDDIRGIFRELCQEVAAVYAGWRFYLDLFTSDENKAMFNEVARSSFKLIERALLTEMIMGLCRLSDPPGTGKKGKCSMRRLAKQAGPIGGLQSKVDEFVSHCEPIREHRNRRTGHADLKTTLEVHPEPLPGISRGYINKALDLAAETLNIVSRHYATHQLMFEAPYPGGAESLVYWLNRGLEAEEAERQKLLGANPST